MEHINIDLKQAICKLFNNIEYWELDNRFINEGGIILNLENIDKLQTILEEKVNKDIKEVETVKANHYCEIGDKRCIRRGYCDGSC